MKRKKGADLGNKWRSWFGMQVQQHHNREKPNWNVILYSSENTGVCVCVCVHAVWVAWGVLEHDGCSVCAYVCWVCMCAHGARRRDGGTLSTCCINYFWQQNFLFHKVGCYLPYFSCSLLFIIAYFGKTMK